MLSKYDEDLMGKICLNIFQHHIDKSITYELDKEAEEVYEAIINKYNGQFNLKYSGKDGWYTM